MVFLYTENIAHAIAVELIMVVKMGEKDGMKDSQIKNVYYVDGLVHVIDIDLLWERMVVSMLRVTYLLYAPIVID